LAKKQKKATPKRVPTKHQLSKWQRQTKIRRIVIIAAVVFLAGILSWVGYESYQDYQDRVGILHDVVIEVNDVSFTMEYYVNMLDIYVNNYINTYLDFYMQAYNYTREQTIQLLTSNLRQNANGIADMITGQVADEIISAELLRQGAENLDIEVAPEEIDAKLEEINEGLGEDEKLPNDRIYRDIIGVVLLQEKFGEYFVSNLTDTMEQAHVQVMLVESEEVASEVITRIDTGSNFTSLVEEFSCNSSIEGDLGWLPQELMPNTMIADTAFNLTIGEISQPIYDETAIKNVGTSGGYWLVNVVDRGEHRLEEDVREDLGNKHFNDWFEKWKENSTIENLLDEEKKFWVVDRVLQGR
jgi:parvulin-like peptidyl-prolyl isomerase